MQSGQIVLHHVGGRWGSHSFPLPSRFERDFVVVLYEADTDAIPGIYEACKDQASELIVLPYCLADTNGKAELHVYANPGLNSLRRLGTTLRDRYRNVNGIDFDFGESGARLIERRTVETHSLDHVLATQASPCPMPDFLSLDIQGCEYEALLGAKESLANTVCGVIAEVEFAEMYVGQKRFQDIHDLLAAMGFEFIRFLTIGETWGPPAPLGVRLSGRQIWADALFLRRPETIATDTAAAGKLRKLCFMAVIFGVIEVAIDCINRLIELPEPPPSHPVAYSDFILELVELYPRIEKIWPPVFSEILPASRVADFARAPNVLEWLSLFSDLSSFDDAYIRRLDKLDCPDDTEFEALLRRYGLALQADGIRDTRRQQVAGIRELLRNAGSSSKTVIGSNA